MAIIAYWFEIVFSLLWHTDIGQREGMISINFFFFILSY